MDKKDITILILIIVAVFAASMLGYKYLNIDKNSVSNVQNSQGGINTEQQDASKDIQVQIDQGGIKAEGSSGGGGSITVCQDKCGDGICQMGDSKCSGLSCVCPETTQTCTQDCR
jgi:hypothetical protein